MEELKGGISFHHEKTNLIIHGGIDDIWFDLNKNKLVVVDYKAQSSSYPVTASSYLSSEWRVSYKVQMDIYVYILRKMKYEVSDITYFYVCNAEKNNDKFDDKIRFKTSLIPYKTDTTWIESKIIDMKKTLDCKDIPEININCENLPDNKHAIDIEDLNKIKSIRLEIESLTKNKKKINSEIKIYDKIYL